MERCIERAARISLKVLFYRVSHTMRMMGLLAQAWIDEI